MKKYILFLLVILVVLGTTLVTNMMMINDNINKSFDNSGYILKNSDNSERYHFSGESTYKNSYNDQIVFKDTEGQKVVVNKYNFIHYEDGSISSFTKGVLLDLNAIDAEPITYYNVSANKVLKKLSNNRYVTKNLDKEIQFENLMWRISDTRYLVAGNSMAIVFADGTEKTVNGFLEIEYSDNEVVKIFNQEVTYETISTDLYLKVGDNVKINLGTKIVSKNDVNEMTLENMVIDSNDNVTIIDLEEYKEDEEENANIDTDQSSSNTGSVGGSVSGIQGGNAGSVSGGDSIANGETTIQGGNAGSENIGGNGSTDVETEIQDDLTVFAPKYTIKEFEVSATGLKTIVEIEDDEARLTTGTRTSIIENRTGREVFSLPEDGATQIRIDTSSLEANTEYTLVMSASYAVEDTVYEKNFIYKVFRTPILGLVLEKDVFTNNSLSFNLKFDKNSPVTKLDVSLLDKENQVISNKIDIINESENTVRILFSNLQSNTEYIVRIENVFVNNISNQNTYTYIYRTLKSIPLTNANLQVDIDKWNSKFVLSIPELEVGMVETLNYQVYTETDGQLDIVYDYVTSKSEITLPISEKIQRNTDYLCRVFATFYDNEKTVEYKIAMTESSFKMNSSETPTIRFETGDTGFIAFNEINGNIIIEDPGNTIQPNPKIKVTYNSISDLGHTGTLTFPGTDIGSSNIQVPIDIKGLKANETYKLSIYTTIDLNDNNGEREETHIGSVMITTPEAEPIMASWSLRGEGIEIGLQLAGTSETGIETQSLYSLKIDLYPGGAGVSNQPEKTITLTDEGENNPIEILRRGDMLKLDQEILGFTDGQLSEFTESNNMCTIVISEAKDYVSKEKQPIFENILPIQSNYKEYAIEEIPIRNPIYSESAINVIPIEKNNLNSAQGEIIATRDYTTKEEIINTNEINNSTPVAYKVTANMSQTLLDRFDYLEYIILDDDENEIVRSNLIQKKPGATEVPSALFLISNGTGAGVDDSNNNGERYLARGNSYRFIYYAYTDAQKNGKFPLDVNENDYWEINAKLKIETKKQDPEIIMYPIESSDGSVTYKYIATDIDNTIIINKDGNRYFGYSYEQTNYDQLGLSSKQIHIGRNNESEDGYHIVTFSGLITQYTSYEKYLKVTVTKNTLKDGGQNEQKELVTQKILKPYENVIPENCVTINTEAGKYSLVEFNFPTATLQNQVAKIELELKDKTTDKPQIDSIIISKTAKELNDADINKADTSWSININYLDLIYKTDEELKDRKFDVVARIYYINEIIGYEIAANPNYVAYQTVEGEWLQISTNGSFSRIKNQDGSIEKPIVYNHTYLHYKDGNNNEFLSIRNNNDEVSRLNYSPQGFVTNLGENYTVVIPKQVATQIVDFADEISLENVLPGISANDVEILTTPTTATITLKKVLYKDTIFNGNTDNITVIIYTRTNLDYVAEKTLQSNGAVSFNNLYQGETYYCRIFFKDSNRRIN